ncbi:Protein NRDE2-like protein [Colletotrichum spinosum]|uniref:Protein NRDE2-like protein n=1 Tax=Colletotrichum spinosum TaxID=1347390 RepID=A0A4R8QEZ2_9PEZI|nr:Protein NRDE2-like protein [Colletotrichum spinosum]
MSRGTVKIVISTENIIQTIALSAVIAMQNAAAAEVQKIEEDFVPLNKSSKRQRTEEPESSADEKPSYRSIEGKAKAHELSDSDVDYDSDPQGGNLNIDVEDPLKQRSIQLSRHVKDHPEDISKWLELIAHQDVLLKANQSLNREVTKGEIQSFAGIKISMYESALAQVKKPEDEELLLLGMMAEGAIAWSSEKLDKRWEAIANEQGSSFCLWRARVDHKLASLTTFKYGDLKAAHVDRLRAVTAQPAVSVSPAPGCGVTPNGVPRYEQMTYVFLRATRLAFDAGYRELAIAAWQALLELNLQRPYTNEGMADSELLSLFRDFWEDEVPRIGDNNAQGWDHYVQSNGTADPAEPQRDEDAIVPSRDVYKSWGATERLRASNARKPGRATDDILMDDPYRVVMFSDIEELLFVIPKEHVPHTWKQLIDGFLIFCSLPPAFRSSKWTEAAESDGALAGCLSLFGKEAVQKANEPDVLDETKKSPVFMQDGIHLANASDILFGTQGWFLYLSGWVKTSKTHDGPVDLGLVAHALRQLTTVESFSDLAEYSLAVDIIQDPDNTKKRAKALIKRSPASLPLYNAYALAEFANGNREVARRVVSSATGLINSSNQRHGLVLWRTWAWMELEAGFMEQAILRLCASVDEFLSHSPELTSATPTQQLKAYHYLSSRLEHQLSSRQLKDAVLTGECHALLATALNSVCPAQ